MIKLAEMKIVPMTFSLCIVCVDLCLTHNLNLCMRFVNLVNTKLYVLCDENNSTIYIQ